MAQTVTPVVNPWWMDWVNLVQGAHMGARMAELVVFGAVLLLVVDSLSFFGSVIILLGVAFACCCLLLLLDYLQWNEMCILMAVVVVVVVAVTILVVVEVFGLFGLSKIAGFSQCRNVYSTYCCCGCSVTLTLRLQLFTVSQPAS